MNWKKKKKRQFGPLQSLSIQNGALSHISQLNEGRKKNGKKEKKMNKTISKVRKECLIGKMTQTSHPGE